MNGFVNGFASIATALSVLAGLAVTPAMALERLPTGSSNQ
jgi:hypothetical protein